MALDGVWRGKRIRWSALRAALAGLLLAPLGSAQADLAFDEVARHWLEAHELTLEEAQRATWSGLLEQRFAHVDLGLFEVFVPREVLADGGSLEEFSQALLALLDTQEAWRDWFNGRPVSAHRPEAVVRWIQSWSPSSFAALDPGGDLASGLSGESRVPAALARLREELRSAARLGTEHELSSARLVLFPERAAFVEFTCVAGELDPALQPSAWNAGLTTWLEYDADGTPFLTLEYAARDGASDYRKGLSVGYKNEQAPRELVAQVASRALLARVFGVGLDPALASAMANTLVIELCGELDTRIDGDVRARVTQGRSVFVPGGNPNGGVLPPTSATNRWRGSLGKDHFVGVLAEVQKLSATSTMDRFERISCFELVSDDPSTKALVRAPFLGPAAAPPPAAVWPDYLELVRCYGIAFVHWLRRDAAGTPSGAAQRYAELLRGLARGRATEELPALFQEIYAQPLTADSTAALFASPTLEGRFLTWLSRR